MTEREAIEVLSSVHVYAGAKCQNAIALAISALEKQEADRWIPVTERLPERGVDVLVTQLPNDWNGKKYKVSPAWRCNIEDVRPHGEWALTGRLDLFASVIPIDKVSAWRPLPEAYTEEET